MLALVVESWIWWSLVFLVFVCRFTSRVMHQGSFKELQVDDWLMCFALATYTVVIVALNIVSNSNSNLFPPGYDYSTLTTTDISEREYGSKLVLVVEQMQCATIWLAKACILIMYFRLTKGRAEHFYVKLLAGYTAFGYVLMEILYLGVWCRPFQNYWAVPTPNVQCNAATNHLITNATLNLSSDVILLCIALPMFVRTQMPARKKVALCCVFGLGIFVMISAILNKYYSFTNPFGSQWTYWYCRESSTSMLVANLPFVYTLFRRMFNLRSLDSTAKYGTKSKTGRTTQTGGKGTLISRAMPEPETGLNNKFFTTTHITGPNAFDEKDSIEEKKSSEEASGIKKNVNVTFTSLPADSEHSFGEA